MNINNLAGAGQITGIAIQGLTPDEARKVTVSLQSNATPFNQNTMNTKTAQPGQNGKKEITIDGVEYIRKDVKDKAENLEFKDGYPMVVLRAADGIYVGYYKRTDNYAGGQTEAHLVDCRRVHNINTIFGLNLGICKKTSIELATGTVPAANFKDLRVTAPVNMAVNNVLEKIPFTEAGLVQLSKLL